MFFNSRVTNRMLLLFVISSFFVIVSGLPQNKWKRNQMGGYPGSEMMGGFPGMMGGGFSIAAMGFSFPQVPPPPPTQPVTVIVKQTSCGSCGEKTESPKKSEPDSPTDTSPPPEKPSKPDQPSDTSPPPEKPSTPDQPSDTSPPPEKTKPQSGCPKCDCDSKSTSGGSTPSSKTGSPASSSLTDSSSKTGGEPSKSNSLKAFQSLDDPDLDLNIDDEDYELENSENLSSKMTETGSAESLFDKYPSPESAMGNFDPELKESFIKKRS